MNNPHSHGYWFVLRDDQNVIFTSNSLQTTQITGQDTRAIVDNNEKGYLEPLLNRQPEPAEGVQAVSVPADFTAPDTNGKQKDCFWDRNKIKLLLTLCLENDLKNMNNDKDLLDSIASHLGTTPDECTTKYRNLRRTFLRLLKKRRQGKDIKWVHYNMCEKVFTDCKLLPSSLLEPWDDFKIRSLLSLYIENLDRFRGTDCLQRDVWKDIASHVGNTHSSCYHKFKNLKRTYLNLMQRARTTGKTVNKWIYQPYFERIFYDFIPSQGPWPRTKTRQLIDAYLQMAEKFKNPKFQKKDLWKEISVIVDESPHNCDKKFRNLKQTYLKLKLRANSGGHITKWRYFKDFDTIFGSEEYWDPITLKPQGEDWVKQLLQFYIDNRHKFHNSRTTKKRVWRLLSSKIGLSSEECDRKFRNLKQTYMRLSEKKRSGLCIKWPYYHYFENIFSESNNSLTIEQTTDTTASDIKRAVQLIHNRTNDDKFEKLITAIGESNNIQKERNAILKALLSRDKR